MAFTKLHLGISLVIAMCCFMPLGTEGFRATTSIFPSSVGDFHSVSKATATRDFRCQPATARTATRNNDCPGIAQFDGNTVISTRPRKVLEYEQTEPKMLRQRGKGNRRTVLLGTASAIATLLFCPSLVFAMRGGIGLSFSDTSLLINRKLCSVLFFILAPKRVWTLLLNGVAKLLHRLYQVFRRIESQWYRHIKTPVTTIEGSNVLVTGASVVDGIGFDIAKRLLQEGAAKVVLTARHPDMLQASAEALVSRLQIEPERVSWVAADLSHPADVEELARQATKEMDGVVDIVVNNAATEITGHATEISSTTVDSVIRGNLIGPQLLTRHLLPGMLKRKRGTFVYFSSILGLVPAPHCATYSSTKTGMRAYTHAMRYEYQSSPVNFGCVSPTHVHGPHGQGARGETSSGHRMPDFYGSVTNHEIADGVVRCIRYNVAEVDNNSYLPTKLYFLMHELGCLQWMDSLLMPKYGGFDHARLISDKKEVIADISERRETFSKRWVDTF